MNVLAENIRKFRQVRGLSQRKLAEKLNMAESSVANWEKGLSTPDVNRLVALCHALEVTPNEMLGWEESQVLVDYMIELNKARLFIEEATRKRDELDKVLKTYHEKFKGLL